MIKKKIDINKLIKKPTFAYQRFHKRTKLSKVPKNELMPYELPDFLNKIYYKSYPRMQEILLPKPKISNASLKNALTHRMSNRSFSSETVNLKDISTLLYYSAGINNNHGEDASSRFYPSGGRKYPLETYILSLNTDLKKGLYHYYVPNNSLEFLTTTDKFSPKHAFTNYNQTWIAQTAFFIIITAVFERAHIQYGERSYRLINLEAGHMGQNLYLLSSNLHLNCCGVAGIVDSYFEELLDIDGTQESVIYTLAFGKNN